MEEVVEGVITLASYNLKPGPHVATHGETNGTGTRIWSVRTDSDGLQARRDVHSDPDETLKTSE